MCAYTYRSNSTLVQTNLCMCLFIWHNLFCYILPLFVQGLKEEEEEEGRLWILGSQMARGEIPGNTIQKKARNETKRSPNVELCIRSILMDMDNPQEDSASRAHVYHLPGISASVSSGCLGRSYCGVPRWQCESAPTPLQMALADAEGISASLLCAASPGSLQSAFAWLPSWSHPAPLGGGEERRGVSGGVGPHT